MNVSNFCSHMSQIVFLSDERTSIFDVSRPLAMLIILSEEAVERICMLKKMRFPL